MTGNKSYDLKGSQVQDQNNNRTSEGSQILNLTQFYQTHHLGQTLDSNSESEKYM